MSRTGSIAYFVTGQGLPAIPEFFGRWASEGTVSISPCHPSYVAMASTTTELPRYPSLDTLDW